jgi:ribosomal protein L15
MFGCSDDFKVFLNNLCSWVSYEDDEEDQAEEGVDEEADLRHLSDGHGEPEAPLDSDAVDEPTQHGQEGGKEREGYDQAHVAVALEDQPPVDPALQVQMADIEQRRLEVESRERIAHLNIEADGYKTQMNIELDKAKMEQDRYIADLKVNLEELLNQTKMDMDMLKIEATARENNADLLQKQLETDTKSEIELLKIEAKERENALKADIEILKEKIKQMKGV